MTYEWSGMKHVTHISFLRMNLGVCLTHKKYLVNKFTIGSEYATATYIWVTWKMVIRYVNIFHPIFFGASGCSRNTKKSQVLTKSSGLLAKLTKSFGQGFQMSLPPLEIPKLGPQFNGPSWTRFPPVAFHGIGADWEIHGIFCWLGWMLLFWP